MLAERITPMGLSKTIWTNPTEFLKTQSPENPVLFFAPSAVQAVARKFLKGFPGLVTYAVKSNPGEEMVENLVAAGVKGFDCASPFEIDLIRRLAPDAAIHYHNPVRSRAEIAHAVARDDHDLLCVARDRAAARPVDATGEPDAARQLRLCASGMVQGVGGHRNHGWPVDAGSPSA